MSGAGRSSLRVRVLAVVLVPALLFVAVAARSSAQEWRVADRARRVQRNVADLAGLVELKSALLLARVPVEVDVRSAALGVDSAAVRELLGLTTTQVGGLDLVGAALDRLPRRDRPFPATMVTELADQLAAGSDAAALLRFDELDELTNRVWERNLLALRYDVVEVGDRRLAAQLTDLDHAASVGGATASMITNLAGFWFSGGDRRAAARSRVALGVAATDFDRGLAALTISAQPEVSAAAESIQDTSGDEFGRAVDEALSGVVPPSDDAPMDLESAVDAFRNGFEIFGPILGIVEGRTDALQATAKASADGSTRTARLSLAVGVAVAIAVLAFSFLLAGSFARPLRRLIDAIRGVGDGDLDRPPLATDGPPEVAAASAAFNDVVRNLQLIEGKVLAMSENELSDPLLARPLPGDLGRALARSIDVLADSISDRNTLHVQLAHEATHDPLTGIANRAGAMATLERAVARLRADEPLLVAFLDLDGFKGINDAYGHRAGDQVLCEVATRLLAHARAGDVVARLGGDEFILIAEAVSDHDVALELATRLAAAVEGPMRIDGRLVSVGVSVGLALAASPDELPLHLLDRADRAAYEAKKSRHGIVVSAVPSQPVTAPAPIPGVARPPSDSGAGGRR